MVGMSRADNIKRERELGVFREFVYYANLPVTAPESRSPQEPDVLCVFSGVPRYFEITSARDERFEEIRAGKNPDAGVSSPLVTDICENLCRVLTEKLGKQYRARDAGRIDVLVYLEIFEIGLMTRLLRASGLKKGISNGPFERVWIYDRTYRGVIGVIDKDPFRIVFDHASTRSAFRAAMISDPRHSLAASLSA